MIKGDAYIKKGNIRTENIHFYKQFGYLVAPAMLSIAEIDELKRETAAIFRGERGKVEGMLPVETNESDADVLKKYVTIYFPHKISPLIHRYLSHQKIVDVLTSVISPNIKCVQSILFVKGPGKAGQAWHQEEFYIPTRDRSLIEVWIAIDNANVENGCLWIIPGRPGYMMRRVPNNNNEYADVDTIDVSQYGTDVPIPVEVEKGSVIFFNGYTLHSSKRNKPPDSFRTALVNHYMSAKSMLSWDQDGKLAPTEDLRDIVMVAGEDPYAWKGIIEANKPYLRPEILKIKTDL